MIHTVQFEDGVPRSLAICFTLVKLWADGANGKHEMVRKTVLDEVRRLLREVCDCLDIWGGCC